MLLEQVTKSDIISRGFSPEMLVEKYCVDCTRHHNTYRQRSCLSALYSLLNSTGLQRVLIFRPFDAPGLFVIGAEFVLHASTKQFQFSATGSGRCFCSAVLRVYGEAAEFETRYRVLCRPGFTSDYSSLFLTDTSSTELRPDASYSSSSTMANYEISAIRLNDGLTVSVPMSSCFLTSATKEHTGPPMSAGMGAAPNRKLASEMRSRCGGMEGAQPGPFSWTKILITK